MPNRVEVGRMTELLVARQDLSLAAPLNVVLGSQPTLEGMTNAALAITDSRVLRPTIDALIHDSSGTELERNPARMRVNLDGDGRRIESLHAIPLASGEGWSARLHVWLEGRDLTMDTHTHTSDFGSAVIAGAFRDEVWARVPGGDGQRMNEYVNDGSTEPVNEVALRPVRRRIIPAGAYHKMGYKAIHSANVIPNETTATVVVRRRRADFANVYTDGPREGTPPWIEPVDAVETLKRLRAVLEA